jgi:ribonuclease HI
VDERRSVSSGDEIHLSPGAVLLVLEKRLTDDFLSKCFPGEQPGDIRSILTSCVSRLSKHEEGIVRKSVADAPLISLEKAGSRLTVYTDGASRGNPGEAGAGAVIFDENGSEIYARGKYLGQCTNNMAEYQALIMGLAALKELGGENIAIFLDSELIVRQLQGRYKVKDQKLKPLFIKASSLLNEFTGWKVGHVPRNENKRADELANLGIDEKL